MRNKFITAMILGVSLILSAVIFGAYFYNSRSAEKSIRVVGSATKRFQSDIIKWRVTISRSVGANNMKDGYALIKKDTATFIEFLKNNSVNEADITIQPVSANPVFSQYEKSGNPNGYNIQQNIFVSSKNVTQIEKIALNPGAVFENGILLQASNLEYYCSKLNDFKRELLAAATKDARKRADVIAASSGDRVGRIGSARVGVFQITEPYSTEVSDYGIYNTATKEKDITVTMNIVFNLK